MDWFEQLTGFAEHSPEQVRSQLFVQDNWLHSKASSQRWYCGRFSAPALHELRQQQPALDQLNSTTSTPRLKLVEQIADVQQLHRDPANANALFQVASQFNLLEMVSPRVTPEQGVGQYQFDRTQGPACAIAGGAGTIWRNYFIPLNGQTGQTTGQQFDALAGLGQALGNDSNRLWHMQNGYLITDQASLQEISQHLRNLDTAAREHLKGLIRTGLQADTQVTLDGCTHRVSQLYCSALPIAYARHPVALWSEFAQLILEAAYEATFFVALQQLLEHGHNRLYLTLLGGGAFGNPTEWIISAIRHALHKFSAAELDVAIVSYGRSHPAVRALVDEFAQHQETCQKQY